MRARHVGGLAVAAATAALLIVVGVDGLPLLDVTPFEERAEGG